MLRLYHHCHLWLMNIFGRQSEGEVGDDLSHEVLKLHHSQMLPDTHTLSKPEGHVAPGALASTRDPILEPLRLELERIWTPYVRVRMQRGHHGPYVHALRHVHVPYLPVFRHLPTQGWRRGIQPHCFLNHHV